MSFSQAGAVEEFDSIRFGGPTVVAESAMVVTTQVRIVVNNPDRVETVIQNNGPDVLYWSFNSNPTFPAVKSLAVGQQMVFQVQNDGAMCAAAIWGVSANVSSALSITELIRQRRG